MSLKKIRISSSVVKCGKCLKNVWCKAITFLFSKLPFVFVVLALAEGFVFFHMVPFGQVPDEMNHWQMIEEEFGTSGYIDELRDTLWDRGSFWILPWNDEAKLGMTSINDVRYEHFSKVPALSDFHPNINIVKHFPAGVGFYLGMYLNLSILRCTYLAEVFNLAFYVLMGALCIHIIPVRKDIMMFCMLIPQCMHQAASVSYDAVMLALSFFMIAYVMKLYYQEQPVRWKNLILFVVPGLIVGMIKPPYALLVCLIFLIPRDHFDLPLLNHKNVSTLSGKEKGITFVLLLLCACAAMYILRNNSFIKTTIANIIELPSFIQIFAQTIKLKGDFLVRSTIGAFGWIDSSVSYLYVVVAFGLLIYLNVAEGIVIEDDRLICRKNRIVLIGVSVCILLLIFTAMQCWTYETYYGWDLEGSLGAFCLYTRQLSWIEGVQGRYFLPIIPLICFGLASTAQKKNRVSGESVQLIFHIYTIFYVYRILYERYII